MEPKKNDKRDRNQPLKKTFMVIAIALIILRPWLERLPDGFMNSLSWKSISSLNLNLGVLTWWDLFITLFLLSIVFVLDCATDDTVMSKPKEESINKNI